MPQPTSSQVHVDAILTNISVAYMQQQANFIASRVFPIVPVSKQSDKFFTYTKNDWFRDEAQRRADATESAGGGYGLSTDTYQADVFAFHKDIGDQTRANADAPIQVDREAAEFVTSRLMLKMETQFVSSFFTTSVWGTDYTPSNLWSDYTSSDPLGDVETGKRAILSTTGFEPNTLVLGYDVFKTLKNHPDLVDRIKYTSSQVITEGLMASLFDIPRVMVAKAVKATNNEGGTAAYDFTHGKNALLTYSAPSAGLLQPSGGYVMSWTGVSQGLGQTIGTSRIRMEQFKADRIEAEIAFDMKVIGSDLGYFFNACVA
ncbi:MAG: hypothetical protein EBS97_00385 [Verrucomicrobia bacterium]|nr:hypothetical protein [Verrucomicrobiota bacterium]